MVDVVFPQGLEGTEKLPKTITQLENCFNVSDRLIARPGIDEITTTTKVSRGQFEYNNTLYQVISDDLIKIDNVETGAYTVIGSIDGNAPIDHAVGFNHAVIISRGGKGYTLDSDETLTEITNSNFVASNSVTHINGRFVFIPSNGDPAFYSDVGDANSIQAASFFDAEELPDKNKVAFNLNNTLYIGGTDSFELFRNTGTDSTAFTRIQNGRVQNGYISSILEYNGTFVFVGREKDQDLGIFAISQGKAIKISNEYIDTKLHDYPIIELEDIIPSRFMWNGYDIVTFTLPGATYGFYGGNWFRLSTQKSDNPEEWQAGYITEHKLKYYTSYKNKIGVLSESTTDYGTDFQKCINLSYEAENDFSVQSLRFSISQGYDDNAGTAGIRVSNDNVLFRDPLYRDLGESGDYEKQLEWNYPGGLGYFRGFIGVKLVTTGEVNFSGSNIYLDVR